MDEVSCFYLFLIISLVQSCSGTCEPNKPCCAPGCPNFIPSYHPGSNPYYYNAGSRGANPNFQGSNYSYSQSPFNGWWNSGANYNYRPASPQANLPNNSAGAVRIGVGNRSKTVLNIDVRDNLVTGGHQGVHLGSGNYAARSNMGVIANNKADADELMIGVDNYVEKGDNKVKVTNNDFTGFQRLRIGVGNHAGGSNRIVVGGFGSNNDGGETAGNNNQNRQHRRKSWLW